MGTRTLAFELVPEALQIFPDNEPDDIVWWLVKSNELKNYEIIIIIVTKHYLPHNSPWPFEDFKGRMNTRAASPMTVTRLMLQSVT